MLTDFQKRKLTRAFEFADKDHDGVLKRDDYETHARQMADAFNTPTDSAAYASIHAQLMRDWEGVRQFVAQGDDMVTLDEWLTFFDGLIHSPMFDPWVTTYIDASFELWKTVDPNGPSDGVNLERFAKFYSAFGMDADKARAAFEKMDTNDDDFMNRDEMIAASSAYFSSDDPSAPGNWLYGAP